MTNESDVDGNDSSTYPDPKQLSDDAGVSAGSVLAKADSPPEPKDKLDQDRRKVVVDRAKADLKLSKVVGYGALSVMGVQVLIADAAFFFYGFENHWKIPAAAIDAWLAAAVIQVIGVVLVITNYLFPAGRSQA
jgi:hypothetical protein